MKTPKRKILSVVSFFVLIVGLLSPLPAIADDGSTPPPDPTATPDVVNGESETQPGDETGAIAGEEGEPSDAEDVVTDPFWCPDGSSPIPDSGGCTTNYSSFTDLLAYLDANDSDPGFQQDGTIYVAGGTYSNEPDITIDGTTYGTMQAFSLTVQGGWDSGTQTIPAGSTTTFSVPVLITWASAVQVFDIEIENVSTDTALAVSTTDDVVVADVTVTGSDGQATADLDAGGDVSITNSSFDNVSGTGGSGLSADADGDVMVSSTTFSGSDSVGADLNAAGNATLDDVTATDSFIGVSVDAGSDVSISDSTFENNGGGVEVFAGGDVTLDHVTASDNDFGGSYIDTSGALAILSSSFERNEEGTGLEGYIGGDLTITDTVLSENGTSLLPGDYGAGGELEAGGTMTLTNVTANDNHDDGLSLYAGWTVYLNNLAASGNGWDGVYIDAGCNDIYIQDGTYADNGSGIHGGYGIEVYCPRLGVNFLGTQTFSGNVTGDVLEDSICIPGEGCTEECEKDDGEYTPVETGVLYPIPCDIDPADFKLASGDGALFYGLCGYEVMFEVFDEAGLPGAPDIGEWSSGAEYLGSLGIQLYLDAEPILVLTDEGAITVSFKVPAGQAHRDYAILFWDTTLNDGEGGWIELPAYDIDADGNPVMTELHDGMSVIEGVLLSPDGNRVQTTVNFTGLFVLIRK